MSTTFRVTAGDTFARIARLRYGDAAEADRIAQANPGVVEPLTPGTQLIVPPLPGLPEDLPGLAAATTGSEVSILINGQRFRFWETVRITRAIDAMDTLELVAPFDADLPGFRDLFRPFSFQPVAATVSDERLFAGTMVAVTPVVDNDRKTVAVSSYAQPGVLNDCTAPASAFPLEFDNQGLRDIAGALAAPFGLSIDFQADQGAVFERVAVSPERKLLAFLTDLAQQRGLLIASTVDGALQFSRPAPAGQPVAVLAADSAPVLSVTPFFSPQDYYSHITGIEPVVVGLAGSQFTVRNARLQGVTRPLTFEVTDTLEADLKAAVEAKAGRMFANMVAYDVAVSTWRTPGGALWAPNTTVKLLAPDAMIYRPYEFLIRSVVFNRGPTAETATLNLIIPGSLSGQVPEVLPWDG